MISRKLTGLAKPSLLILSAVVLFLSASHAFAANSPNALTSKAETAGVAKAKVGKRSLNRTLNRKTKATLAKLLTACGCTAAALQDGDGFGSCFKGCLGAWGINPTTINLCAGSCIAATTGNPIAIAFCASCLGTTEWIVGGCAMKCAWGGIAWEQGLVKNQLPRPRSRSRGSQAKLTRQNVSAG